MASPAQIAKQIERYRVKIGKKRDELRKLLEEVEPLFQSLDSAVDGCGAAIEFLRLAENEIESAAGELSTHA